LTESILNYYELSKILSHDGEPVFGGKINARVPIPQPDGTARIAAGFVRIYNAFFSDTFIIWTETHPLGVWTFNSICNEVFCKAIENQIPIRGCISSGEAIMD